MRKVFVKTKNVKQFISMVGNLQNRAEEISLEEFIDIFKNIEKN